MATPAHASTNTPNEQRLATSIAGVSLTAPVLLAAGTNGTLDEFADVLDLSRIGGVVTKSITRDAREGNDTWRILPARGQGVGMLNAIGLANPGIDGFERDYLPRAAAIPCRVIASVAGYSIDDYVVVAQRFNAWANRGVAAIEMNVSCPNVKAGCDFGSSPAMLQELVTSVKSVVTDCPLFVKLSPWPMGLIDIARAAVHGGADALTISNTMPAMEINVHTRKPVLANITGGLSGPAIRPVSVKLVYEVSRKVCREARGTDGQSIPIIGAGGVCTWEDAAEFILAGASAVQMGTALFADPRSPLKVISGLDSWARSLGADNIRSLVGTVQT